MGWWEDAVRAQGPVHVIRITQLGLIIVILLVSGLPLGVSNPRASASAGPAVDLTPASPHPLAQSNDTVTVQNQTIGNLSNFWGVGLNPGYNVKNMTNETQGTPINWAVWPAGDVADSFDMTNGTVWTDGVPSQDQTNESQFVAACEAISCHAIFTVPGEIDNPSFAAYEVAYTEQVLHFFPAYWEIGNEPHRWQHFGESWPQWNSTLLPLPSPATYAQVVHSYIAAMKTVDSSLRFIGLPGAGNGTNPDGPWLNATVQVNGPNLSAVAIHIYPGQNGLGNDNLTNFFATLTAPNRYMVTRIATDEKQVKAEEANIGCTTCSIQLFVDEFGAGTNKSQFQPFMHTYAEIPYVTAELLMLSQSNVNNTDLYELRSGFNGSLFNGPGLPHPVDSLYTQILPHYDSIPLNTTVTGTQKGVFAGVSDSTGSNSLTLLAVNTNLAQSVQLNVSGDVFPSAGTFEIWRENNSTAFPDGTVSQSFGFESSPSWVIPPLGVILVSVCRSNASLGSGGLYPLTFCASGLPAGATWSVTVGSNTIFSTSGTITFSEPNGTYTYQIGSIPGWQTANTSGNLTVDGAPASVQVPWTLFAYPVRFNESGLPAGTLWSVDLGGTLLRSNTTNITGEEPNGTHAYSLGIVSGWRTQAARGFITVVGAPLELNLTWSQVTYNVTFHESGLPVNTNWSIGLAGSTGYNTTGGPIRFLEPNGTYSFTVGSVVGYTPDTTSGPVTVVGASKYVPLSWAKNSSVFSVQFNETGLPGGTSWNITLNGTLQSGTTTNFTFREPNGNYSYLLGGAVGWAPSRYAGSVTVFGSAVFVAINYARVTYDVAFNETGLPNPLPSGSWSVTLNGVLQTSTGPSISFLEPNGTYAFVLGAEPGYTTSSFQGSVKVNGFPRPISIFWTLTNFSVTFSESGLWNVGGGTTWTLNVTGQAPVVRDLTDPPYVDELPNGTYSCTATTSLPGVALVPSVRDFTVSDGAAWVNLTFVSVYSVEFVESGLPASARWSVVLNNSLLSADSSTISFTAPNGTYNFSVGNASRLFPLPATGQVRVNGGTKYVAISFGPETWPVSFTESGLPVGTNWSVSLADTTHYSDGTPTVNFRETNGTYDYLVGSVDSYAATPSQGSLTINGGPANVTTVWGPGPTLYTVTFTENGLPSGKNWSVLLGGTTEYSDGTTAVHFLEANGTYDYVVNSISGYTPSPSSGDLSVQGAGMSPNVTYARLPPPTDYTVTFTETGLPSAKWSVTLGGTTNTSNPNKTVTFSEPNGTYPFEVGAVTGYSASPSFGNLTVDGGPLTQPIAFTIQTTFYNVTFTETGLTAGTGWSVKLGGVTHSASTPSILFSESKGTYYYTISPVTGWALTNYTGPVTVFATNQTIPVPWLLEYSLTFNETGLTSGTLWNVTIDNVTLSSNGSGIEFLEPNGTFAYRVGVPLGFSASRNYGNVTVRGDLNRVGIAFSGGSPGGGGGSGGWQLSRVEEIALAVLAGLLVVCFVSWALLRHRRGPPPPPPDLPGPPTPLTPP